MRFRAAWAAAVVLAVAGSGSAAGQDERERDLPRLSPPIAALCRTAAWGEAEAAIRDLLSRDASDGNRRALVEVLLWARRVEACVAEARILEGSRDPLMAAAALAARAQCAVWTGDADVVREASEEAIRILDGGGGHAAPELRASIRWHRTLLDWRRMVSRRCVAFASPGAGVAEGGGGLLERLDAAFDRLAFELDSPLDQKVVLYLFADQAEAAALTGVVLNAVYPREAAIYVSARAFPVHQLVHLHAFHSAAKVRKEPPGPPFLREGLAWAFGETDIAEGQMRDTPRELLRAGKLRPVAALLLEPVGGSDLGAVGGAFVRWLWRTEGRERFLKLWRGYSDTADPWSAAFGRSLEVLDAAWRSEIGKDGR